MIGTKTLHGSLLALVCAIAWGPVHAQDLTRQPPACKPVPSGALPDKYRALARKNKDFAWVLNAGRDTGIVSGGGWEHVEGTGTRDWFTFYRFDIDNDGYCDWYVNASSPLSSGGDRDSINTLYLGRPGGWLRIGARSPNNKPDQLGFGKAEEEQERYLFGEEPGLIYDTSQKRSYLVAALYSRNEQRGAHPGYRILAWDPALKNLRVLDKWAPGSKAAQVYAFFKKNGAYRPAANGESAEDAIMHFDQDQEAYELQEQCGERSEESPPASPHLLAACKLLPAR